MSRDLEPGVFYAGLAVLALSWACGQTAAPSPNTSDRAKALSPPPGRWSELSQRERKLHMSEHVLPAMEAKFKAFDAARYAGFSCVTCHGKDMVARNFAMPNPTLRALHPTGSPEQKQMVREQPEMVRFMFNHVVPSVQTMLGAEAYDATQKSGFSCYVCHPSASGAAEGTVAKAESSL
jgi:hypothetical protein